MKMVTVEISSASAVSASPSENVLEYVGNALKECGYKIVALKAKSKTNLPNWEIRTSDETDMVLKALNRHGLPGMKKPGDYLWKRSPKLLFGYLEGSLGVFEFEGQRYCIGIYDNRVGKTLAKVWSF